MLSAPVYLINLKSAAERRRHAIAQLNNIGISPDVIDAFDGNNENFPFHEYASLFPNDHEQNPQFHPTTFACYLSHAACWEKLLKSDSSYALIVEDDLVLHEDKIDSFVIDDVGLFDTFDVIYVNSRTRRWLNRSSSLKFKHRIYLEARGRGLTDWQKMYRHAVFKLLPYFLADEKWSEGQAFVNVSDVLTHRIKDGYFARGIPASGGDGYILSKRGASKLLQIMKTRRINSSVDFHMQFYSLSQGSIDTLNKLPVARLPKEFNTFVTQEKIAQQLYEPINLESYIYVNGPIISQGGYRSLIRFCKNRSFHEFTDRRC